MCRERHKCSVIVNYPCTIASHVYSRYTLVSSLVIRTGVYMIEISVKQFALKYHNMSISKTLNSVFYYFVTF